MLKNLMNSRILQVLIFLVGAFIIRAAIVDVFEIEGVRALELPFWIAGIGLFFWGFNFKNKWRCFSWWLVLALSGHASALQLINSPPWGVYQQYYQIQELLAFPRLIFLLMLILQSILVLWSGRAALRWLKENLLKIITLKQAILFLAFMGFASSLVAGNFGHYAIEILLALWISIINILNLILVAASIPTDDLQGIYAWLKRFDSPNLNKVFPFILALWVTLCSATIAWFVFEGVPHIPDSVSYLFQAKYFSTGRLFLPAPPEAGSFSISHVVNDGEKWYAYGFPGWPAVLSLGVLMKTPWLINPIIGGVTMIVIYFLLRHLFNQRIAFFVCFLIALSPWFIFMSASFMAHSIALFWVVLAMFLMEKARQSLHWLWGALSGCCLGVLFLTRPLVGILIGAVLGLWALGIGGKRLHAFPFIALILTGCLVGGLIFPYNMEITGDPFYTPQMKWTDENWGHGVDRLGFGAGVGHTKWPHLDPLPGHGLPDVILNLNKNFYMTNFELFGWSFGSIVFVLILVLFKGLTRQEWIFVAIIISIIVGHSFYWNSGGPDFGARYWYQVLLPFSVLTIRGLQTFKKKVLQIGILNGFGVHFAAFVFTACFVAFVNVMPWRSISKYKGYRGFSAEVKRLAERHNFSRSLVLVKAIDSEDFASAFVLNSPTLEGDNPIYALETDAREILQSHFPDRPVWVIGRYPTWRDPIKVLAGPDQQKSNSFPEKALETVKQP